MIVRGWRWFYGKVRAAAIGGLAGGGIAHGAVELVEELNGDATLTATQHALVVQVVTLVGALLLAALRTEDHVPSAAQLAALAAVSQGPSPSPVEPAPTPPHLRMP